MTPTKVLECIRDRDGLHSNAASYDADFVQRLAKELLEVRANRAALAAQVIRLEEAGKKLCDNMLLVGRQLEQADADVRMWKGNYEAAEQHVTILRNQLDSKVDDFCDAVLAKLKALGVPETDNCDGDEDVSTILAGWIHSRILEARDKCHDSLAILSNGLTGAELERDRLGSAIEEVAHATTLWDAHAIAHNALKSESPAGRAAAEGSADETSESQSGAGSASSKDHEQK